MSKSSQSRPKPSHPQKPNMAAVLHTKAGDALKVHIKTLRSFGAKVDEWEDTWVFKNGEGAIRTLIAPKVFVDECRHPSKAAEDLVRISTKQELVDMVQSVTIKYGENETRATFERHVDKKLARAQLEEYVYKTITCCEDIFRHASKATINKFLEDKGWPGINDANNFTKRSIALSLCCKLYERKWITRVKELGSDNVKLGVYVKPCQRCVDRKHDPKKCRQTQSWLKQGFPRDIVVPEPTAHNTSKSVRPVATAHTDSETAVQVSRAFNARQRKQMKKSQEKGEFVYCFLTEQDLRILHWQVTHSDECLQALQKFFGQRRATRLPDDLRPCQKHIDFKCKDLEEPESKTPEPGTVSERAIPQLLLQEVMAAGFGLVNNKQDLDKFRQDDVQKYRECQQQHIGFTNISVYDPQALHINEEDAPGWRSVEPDNEKQAQSTPQAQDSEAAGATVVQTPGGIDINANVGPIEGLTSCGKCGAPATEMVTKFSLKTSSDGKGLVVGLNPEPPGSASVAATVSMNTESDLFMKSLASQEAKDFWIKYSQDEIMSWNMFDLADGKMIADGVDWRTRKDISFMMDCQLREMSAFVTGVKRIPHQLKPSLKRDWATTLQAAEAMLSEAQFHDLQDSMSSISEIMNEKIALARKYLITELPEPPELYSVFVEDLFDEMVEARKEYLNRVQSLNREEREAKKSYHETGAKSKKNAPLKVTWSGKALMMIHHLLPRRN